MNLVTVLARDTPDAARHSTGVVSPRDFLNLDHVGTKICQELPGVIS